MKSKLLPQTNLMLGQEQFATLIDSQLQASLVQDSKRPSKVTKVRRTRQSRNPQLSVARRNERERNRVKMVNNGFSMLRDHLPVEYLQQAGHEESGSETPDVSTSQTIGEQKSNAANKAKKFSKVETLRAAIQHIRWLEQLIRSAEPGFESINIKSNTSEESLLGYDELDGGPLSIGEPASCASSSSLGSNTISHQQQQQSYQLYEHHQNEQFVKLEPQTQNHLQIQPPQTTPQMQSHQYQMTTTTQVQHIHNPELQQQQQQQQQLMSPATEEDSSKHTHLWIQQHQTPFNEQQQDYTCQTQTQWYPNSFVQQQQQQQQNLVLEQQLSPVSLDSPAGQMQPHHHQAAQQQIWYTESSPSPQSNLVQQHLQGAQMNQPAFNNHQQHQISLYSQ